MFIFYTGECIEGFDASMSIATVNKTNRHSFCEYNPFTTRKCVLKKTKFCTPNSYKSNQDECAIDSNVDLFEQNGDFNLLPLIGESRLSTHQIANDQMRNSTQHLSSIEIDNMGRDQFYNDQKGKGHISRNKSNA